MVAVLWVSLPRSWSLTEVQAGLQVCIALLCTWGIFAFSRFCWQLSSNMVRKKRAVALASLMSISTIGEAFDVISLLRRRIFLQRYWKLLAQSIVVICLTVATIVSGPIAKASTRVGSVTKVITIPGNLATRQFASRVYANVDWNQTTASLNQAGFPLDQLLDYMPQPNSTWVYQPHEWNNSWTMECNKTENTPITLFATGVCGNLSSQLPATRDFFAYDQFDEQRSSWQGTVRNDIVEDAMAVFTGWTYPGYESSTNTTYNMTVTVAVMRMRGLVSANDSSPCDFEAGPARSASYTRMECFIKRPRTVPDEFHMAHPDAGDYWALQAAYNAAYYDRFVSESVGTTTPVVLSPDELIRFYQAYIITKDEQWPQPVQRQLSAKLQVVQLSSTFIAFGALFALMVVLGIVQFTVYAWNHKDHIRETPQSKLDWVLQSILDEREAAMTTARRSSNRRSFIAQSALTPHKSSEKVRHIFERAKYGDAQGEEVPLAYHGADVPVTTPAGTPASFLGQSPDPGSGWFTSPSAHNGWAGDTTHQYNANPFGSSYANPNVEMGPEYGLPQPETAMEPDHRRGYQRLGGVDKSI